MSVEIYQSDNGYKITASEYEVMEPNWPNLAAKRKIGELEILMQQVEQKTGVKFPKEVPISFYSPEMVGVTPEGKLAIGSGFYKEDSPTLEIDQLDGIISHEAGHIYYQDEKVAEHLKEVISNLYLLQGLNSLGIEDSQKFTKVIKSEFGDVKTYINQVSAYQEVLFQEIDRLEVVYPKESRTPEKMLKQFYKDPKAIALPPEIKNLGSKIRMHCFTPFKGKFAVSGSSPGNEAAIPDISVTDEECELVRNFTKKMDLMDQISELSIFNKNYSSMAEYRADDFALTHIDDPSSYIENKQKLMDVMMQNPQFAAMMQSEHAGALGLDELKSRDDRSRCFLKKQK